MSASYVRFKAEQWCGEVAQATGIPFYTTINEEVDPPDDVWWTVEYGALFHDGLLCQKGYLEEGFIRVVFMGQPGIGWNDTILALEQVIPLLMAKLDNTRRLEFSNYDPLVEESAGSAEPRYAVSVSVNYIHKL